jgi:hypothetical protein
MALAGRELYTERPVSDRKRLSVLSPADTKLGRPTVMDRALAQQYGADYVHVAAFAIDVDRLRAAHEHDPSLPFAWEVALTELRLVRLLDEVTNDPARLIEDMCLAVMELPRPADANSAAYGVQLPFAVYTGWARGLLPDSLEACFEPWKKLPEDLYADVTELLEEPGRVATIAKRCLALPLTPPLVPPVQAYLEKLARGE